MMKKVDDKQVLIRLPGPMVKKLDAAAKRHERSRVAEIRIRLGESLKRKSVEGQA